MAVTTDLMLVTSLLAACCLNLVVAGKTQSTAGTDFYVAFMGLNNEAKLNRYMAQVFLTNPNQADVEVHTDYLGFHEDSEVLTITAHSTRKISLTLAVVLSTSGVHRGCARVTSTLDIYVQASLENVVSSRTSMVGYPILPTASLGAEYIVATHCSSGQCVFLVTATENNTDVRISLRVSKSCAKYSDSDYCKKDQIDERLHQGESLLVTCECDMTGTRIQASGKVSVVAGGDYTQFENGSANEDAVADQMFPLEWLGTSYMLGTGLQNVSTITKVVVLEKGQAFLHDGIQQMAATTERQVYVFPSGPSSSEVTIIESKSPLLVVQVIGTLRDRPATSMYVAVATDLWSDAYRVYLPLDGWKSKAYICLLMPPEANYTVDGANSDTLPVQRELTENVVSMNLTRADEQVDIAVRMILVERACLFTISSNHPFTGYVIDDGYYGSAVLPLLWGVSPEQETSGNQKETLPPAAQKISQDTTQRATRIPGASTPNIGPSASVGTQRVTETTDSSPAATSTREVHLGTGAHAQQKPPEMGGTAVQHSATSAVSELNLVTEERSSGAAGTTEEVSGTRRGKSPHASAALPETNDNTAPPPPPPEAPGTSLRSERRGATAGTAAVTVSANNDPVTKTTLAYSPNWDQTSTKTAVTVSPNVVTGRQQREGKPTRVKPACCRCVRKTEPAARANEASEGDNRAEGLQRLKKELLSDRKSLSSYGRTRGCRRDARKSSAVIGTTVGIVAFVASFSFVVIPDVVCLCRQVAPRLRQRRGRGLVVRGDGSEADRRQISA